MRPDQVIVYIFLFLALYFEVLMLVSFIRRKQQAQQVTDIFDPTNAPTVAVIVPCWNEEQTVAFTLHSLLGLVYPTGKLEIIVVDDGSTDGTLDAARQFESDPRVKVFSKENGGKHSAMNFALKHTHADIIGCLDADSAVEPDALIRMIPAFKDERVAAVTPGIHVRAPQTVVQYMQEAEYRLSIFNRFMLAVLGATFVTPGPFSLLRTDIVRQLGGWRYAHSTEDMEMAMRLQEHGYLIANTPAATVLTSSPRTVYRLYRQRVRWTYGFLRNAIDYRHMYGSLKYGNLGLIVLPIATLSIMSAIYFFLRVIINSGIESIHNIVRYYKTGVILYPHFSLFYIDTSVLFFLIIFAVVFVVVLISTGTYIATGKRMPPRGTPLFLMFYSFLVPFWLGSAVVKAALKTGVRWR